MSKTALVLAAHGSRIEPITNAQLADAARSIADRGLFDEVTPAFHHGQPTFAAVLDGLEATDIVVVPVMTSAGYFCDVVLPRELSRNRRFADVRLRQTPPVGIHPSMVSLVLRRIDQLCAQFGLEAAATCVAIVGHGTERHAGSRQATVRLAASLTASGSFGQVLFAFLDEHPGVDTILPRTSMENVIVVPFLISGGPHANVDIPGRLGHSGGTPPFSAHIGDRRVICDRAIGTDPAIVDIIVALATSTSVSRSRPGRDSSTPSDCQGPALALGVLNSE